MAESLLDRIKKSSTIKIASVMSESKFFNDVDETSTEVPAINIALSGSLDGGLKSGILTIAGESRHFKTTYALILASAYMKKHPEAILLFYDSEFGSSKDTMHAVGIDTSRVVHTPVKDFEELKFDIVQQLTNVNKGDKMFIVIDSIGNLASKKEVDDAVEGKSVAEMQRAKFIKGFYRIITPYLRIKDIPLVQIGHVYKTQEMFPKTIVSGGGAVILASDAVWVIGRSQEKDGTDLLGYNFNINIEKSRYVVEKTKIPVTVKFDGGLSKYSGLLDIAVEGGCVIKPSNGWFSRVDDEGEIENKKWRRDDTDAAEFWTPMLKSKKFQEYIEKTYKLSQTELIADDDIAAEIEKE